MLIAGFYSIIKATGVPVRIFLIICCIIYPFLKKGFETFPDCDRSVVHTFYQTDMIWCSGNVKKNHMVHIIFASLQAPIGDI